MFVVQTSSNASQCKGGRLGENGTKLSESGWYEVVETIDEDTSPLLLRILFRDRQKYWEDDLGAAVI